MDCEVINLWHKDRDLQGCDFIILPGGFSYGDYLRSGAIARFSPIMQEVIGFANKGGYVLGICNGFQILTESHLLPGALLHNDHQKFNCKNVYLKIETTNSLVTSAYKKGDVIKIPIAHGEGRYYADEKTIINETQKMLKAFGKQKYICNLGHGLYPDIDKEKVKLFVEVVKGYKWGN